MGRFCKQYTSKKLETRYTFKQRLSLSNASLRGRPIIIIMCHNNCDYCMTMTLQFVLIAEEHTTVTPDNKTTTGIQHLVTTVSLLLSRCI